MVAESVLRFSLAVSVLSDELYTVAGCPFLGRTPSRLAFAAIALTFSIQRAGAETPAPLWFCRRRRSGRTKRNNTSV